MLKLLRLLVLACLVCALDPLSIASAPPSKSTKEKSAKMPTVPKALARGNRKGRPSGQDLAKEFKENIKKTGSLTGRHHPAIDSAIKSAKARRKQLLVVFVTKQCPHCTRLRKETIDNRQFRDRYLEDYMLCLVDCDKSPDVAEHYLYDSSVPHSKIINGNGQIVRQVTGYADDEKYAKFLETK